MFKRIKEWFESMAYAGLKPTTPGAPAQQPKEMSSWRMKLERFLAGPATSDPLYLTNRTLWQKIRPYLVVGIPIGILLGGLTLGLMNIFGAKKGFQTPPPSISNAEIAKKSLAFLNKPLDLPAQKEIDIQDVMVPEGSMRLQGAAKNLTDHEIHHVHVVFDLTDNRGSRLGAVSTDVENIPANAAKPFQFPVSQKLAAFAIVRDVQVN
jgi:hypothetical protein